MNVIDPVVKIAAAAPPGGYILIGSDSTETASVTGSADLRATYVWSRDQVWQSDTGAKGTFGSGFAGMAFTDTSTDGSSSKMTQTTICTIPGYYIATVKATATLHDDDDGTTPGGSPAGTAADVGGAAPTVAGGMVANASLTANAGGGWREGPIVLTASLPTTFYNAGTRPVVINLP